MWLEQLQALYDSEISHGITTFWDAGWDWHLGPVPGEDAIARGTADTHEEAARAVIEAALVAYPDSEFARAYRKRAAEGREE